MLPTKKKFVSFSEIKDWHECPYKHYLKHIKKIKLFKPTVHTEFGTAVHEACEHYLKTGELDYSIAEKYIKEAWKKHKLDPFEIKDENDKVIETRTVDWYIKSSRRALEEVPMFLDLTFPDGWRVASAEEKLYEKLPMAKGIFFMGYVDTVLVTGPDDDPVYHILDWKTSEKGWKRWKREDEMTSYQPVYYREFWAVKNKRKKEGLKCGFVILSYGKSILDARCELIPVKPTRKKRLGALRVLNNMVGDICSGKTPRKISRSKFAYKKPGSNCTYCDYKKTEHCDGWKK